MIRTFYLIVAVGLMLAFFRIARVFAVRNRVMQKITPALTLIELLLGTILVFWSANIFLSSRSYYSILVLTLAILFALLITWFYLKDVVAGYIFRMRHNPLKGQILTWDNINGNVRRLGLSQLTVETSAGHWLRIPYSSLVTTKLSLESPKQTLSGQIALELVCNHGNSTKMERDLRVALAQSPWWIATKPINIQFIPEENKVKISFFLLDHIYSQRVKERLTRLLDKD